jgi:hypothetical protein
MIFVLADETTAKCCLPVVCAFDYLKGAKVIIIQATDTHKDLDSDNQPTLFASQDKLAVRTTKVKSCTMNELFGW